MTLRQIKNIADDCQNNTRWAELRMVKDWYGPPDRARIIGIGRKYIRLMYLNGEVMTVEPSEIVKAW